MLTRTLSDDPPKRGSHAARQRAYKAPARRAGLFCGCRVRNISSSSSVAGEHRISEADAMSFNFSAVGVTSCRKGCMTAASTDRLHESAARHDEQKPSNLTESESRGCRLPVAAWLVSLATQKSPAHFCGEAFYSSCTGRHSTVAARERGQSRGSTLSDVEDVSSARRRPGVIARQGAPLNGEKYREKPPWKIHAVK